MADFIPIPNAWSVTLSGVIGNSTPWAMVFGISDFSPHDQTRADQIHQVFLNWWTTDQAAITVSSVALNQIRVTDQADEQGLSAVYPIANAIAGGRAVEPAGSQVCAMVTLLTGGRGRSRRGRKYVPGVAAIDIDSFGGTELEQNQVNALSTSFNLLVNAIRGLAGGPQLAVLSRVKATAYPVSGIEPRLHLGGQRGRRNNSV